MIRSVRTAKIGTWESAPDSDRLYFAQSVRKYTGNTAIVLCTPSYLFGRVEDARLVPVRTRIVVSIFQLDVFPRTR